VPKSQHRRAARHGLDHDQAERLWPVDGKEQGARLAKEAALLLLVDLANELDAGLIEQGRNVAPEVSLIGAVDLGRDLERQAHGTGNRDGAVDALFRGYAPKERQISAAGHERGRKEIATPSDKALAGDYMMTVRANGDGISESVNFRTTIVTSTMWGVVGLGVIAASLVVLLGAVGRFGRR
jgi:hypothetical protein